MSETSASKTSSTGWQVFVLIAAASYTSLDTWVSNPEGPSLLTALTFAAGVSLASLGLRWAMVRAGLDAEGATNGLAVFVLLFTVGGSLIDQIPGGRIGIGLIGVGLGAIVYRLRRLTLMRLLVTWGAFALVLGPVVSYLATPREISGDLHIEGIHDGLEVTDTRDVVMVVADAYTNAVVLEEFYGYDNSGFVTDLEEIGFVVPPTALANYSHTTFSIPSMLQMEYVVGEASLTGADLAALYEIMGGDSSLASILQAAGYEIVYVESGWLGTQCADTVDLCVLRPWPDEALYDIAYRSLLRDLPGFETGRSFMRGAQQALQWLESDLPDLLSNSTSEFIYVHVLAPHPPLFLDETCEGHPSAEFGGFAVGRPGLTADELEARKSAYLSEIECVNGVLADTARLIAQNDAIGLFLGDHGPDSNGQLYYRGDLWSDAMIRERFGAFVAAYGTGCPFEAVGSLIDLTSTLVGCMGADDTPEHELRTYVYSPGAGGSTVVEVQPPSFEGTG